MREQATDMSRKKNFYLSADLDDKISNHIGEVGINFSQLIRELLSEWVEQKEQKKIEKEIIDACEFYYDVDRKLAEEWRAAEAEV